MSAVHPEVHRVHIDRQAGGNAIAATVCAVLAILGVGAIFVVGSSLTGIAGAEAAEVEIRQVEKRPLEREWVWKKQQPSFDHMWRVPR
jgi:hypothetical protein